jgi:hypothetical protein
LRLATCGNRSKRGAKPPPSAQVSFGNLGPFVLSIGTGMFGMKFELLVDRRTIRRQSDGFASY